jgi:uncharacterized integral membrane protein
MGLPPDDVKSSASAVGVGPATQRRKGIYFVSSCMRSAGLKIKAERAEEAAWVLILILLLILFLIVILILILPVRRPRPLRLGY